MRVLHCIHSIDPQAGGTSEFVRQSATLHAARGLKMEVACLDAPSAEWLQNFPVPVHALGPGAGNYGYCRRYVPWLKEHAADFDVVVINGLWQYSSFGTWLALKGGRTPYVVFPHGMLDPWFNDEYPLKRLKKQIYWLLCEQHVVRDASAVFFTSNAELERSATSFVPYQAKSVTVPFGTSPAPAQLDVLRSEFLATNPALLNKLIILFLGRLHAKKGCDLLIGAFNQISARNPHVQLVIAGPGTPEYCRELEQAIGGNPAVLLMDRMIGGDAKWGLLAAADAMILPSHQENFALVVSESLSCSTPVLLSDKVNIYDRVVAGGAGFAGPDTFDGTTSLLNEFLVLSAEERSHMRIRAKECYEQNFDLSKNFSAYLDILASYCK